VSPSQSSLAIILRARAYGESDKIVTFLTEDLGKLTGIAKGAKNSRRRFANCLDPFTRVRVHFRSRPGAGLVFMESCDLLQPPSELSEPRKFAYASYLVELVDQLTADGQPVRELHDLLCEGLGMVREGPATAALLRAFELRVLECAGYGPQLEHCSRCRRSVLAGSQAYLDPMQGSVWCAACRTVDQAAVPVSAATLAALAATRGVSLADLRHRRLAPEAASEAAQVMGRLLALHLPRPMRSVKLIAALSLDQPAPLPE
jgi:DNA repair protein RecO (recombination protein O)